MITLLTLFCGLSFLAYGISCFSSEYMRREFERYGLANLRKLTGFLELLGAVGLLVGLAIPIIGLMASFGLSLLMLLGFGVRLKIRDPFHRTLPALGYMLMCLFLFRTFLHINQATP